MTDSSAVDGIGSLLPTVTEGPSESHDMNTDHRKQDGVIIDANQFESAFGRASGERAHEMEEEDGGAVHTSDSEGHSQQLEVIFDKRNEQRRRASMVPDTVRPPNGRKRTSCFVHALLEEKMMRSDSQVMPNGNIHKLADKDINSLQDDGHHTQSRLLTKKQLSDMAFGIRELSKKLGRVRLLLKVRNVFILTKAHDQKLIKLTRDLSEWLLQQENADGKRYNIWVEDTMKSNKAFDAEGLLAKDPSYANHLRYWDNELCAKKPHTFEICLALGGDGTVLYASWLFQRIVPPVMSFALGSLGFLTKFDYGKYPETLTKALGQDTQGITVSLRLRFEGTVMRSRSKDDHDEQRSRDMVDELIGSASDDVSTHYPDGSHNILNDIVIDRGPNPTMSSIEVFGDDEHFTTVQADGICVATPTGSTAYNLAAGGSLCHPDNPVILVTAIAPHTLSFRPVILPDTLVLRIGVPYDARASCWASFDGKERSELRPGDYVTISASRFPFPSVLPLDRRTEDWVDSISRTLNWNNRQRQKAFDEENKVRG